MSSTPLPIEKRKNGKRVEKKLSILIAFVPHAFFVAGSIMRQQNERKAYDDRVHYLRIANVGLFISMAMAMAIRLRARSFALVATANNADGMAFANKTCTREAREYHT